MNLASRNMTYYDVEVKRFWLLRQKYIEPSGLNDMEKQFI